MRHPTGHAIRTGLVEQSTPPLSAPGLPIERHWFLVHPVDARLRPAALRLQEAIVGLKGSYLPNSRAASSAE